MPIEDHAAAIERPSAPGPTRSDFAVSPSRRMTPTTIESTPTIPPRTMSAMTAMPVQWMRLSGMNSNSARVSPSCGPRAAYMNAAKKAATPTAMAVPATGRV